MVKSNSQIFKEILWCQFPSAKKCANLESISPTFYAQLFCTKVLRAAFLHVNFRFKLFLVQEYWRKCAQKMLVKLTPKVEENWGCSNDFRTKKLLLKCWWNQLLYVAQWFPTGVPRHTRVLQRCARGAAKFGITAF